MALGFQGGWGVGFRNLETLASEGIGHHTELFSLKGCEVRAPGYIKVPQLRAHVATRRVWGWQGTSATGAQAF